MSRVWVHVQYSRVQWKVDNVNCFHSTGTLCTSVARELGVIPTFWVLKFRVSTSQNLHQCLGHFVLLSDQFLFNIRRFNEYVMLINSVNASCRNMFLGTSLSRRDMLNLFSTLRDGDPVSHPIATILIFLFQCAYIPSENWMNMYIHFHWYDSELSVPFQFVTLFPLP